MSKANKPEFNSPEAVRKRYYEAERIMKKYPDKVPYYIAPKDDSETPPLDKNKYMVPKDSTLDHVMAILRKRLQDTGYGLSSIQGLYIFTVDPAGNHELPTMGTNVSELYYRQKKMFDGKADKYDNMVHLYYGVESAFGSN